MPLRLRPGTTIALPAPADDAGVHERAAASSARRGSGAAPTRARRAPGAGRACARGAAPADVDAARPRSAASGIHPDREQLVDHARAAGPRARGQAAPQLVHHRRRVRPHAEPHAVGLDTGAGAPGDAVDAPRALRRAASAASGSAGFPPRHLLPGRPQCSRRHRGTHAHESCRRPIGSLLRQSTPFYQSSKGTCIGFPQALHSRPACHGLVPCVTGAVSVAVCVSEKGHAEGRAGLRYLQAGPAECDGLRPSGPGHAPCSRSALRGDPCPDAMRRTKSAERPGSDHPGEVSTA